MVEHFEAILNKLNMLADCIGRAKDALTGARGAPYNKNYASQQLELAAQHCMATAKAVTDLGRSYAETMMPADDIKQLRAEEAE